MTKAVQAVNEFDDVGVRHAFVDVDFLFDGFSTGIVVQADYLEGEMLVSLCVECAEDRTLLPPSQIVHDEVVPYLPTKSRSIHSTIIRRGQMAQS